MLCKYKGTFWFLIIQLLAGIWPNNSLKAAADQLDGGDEIQREGQGKGDDDMDIIVTLDKSDIVHNVC